MLKKLAGSALAAVVLVGGLGAAAVAGLHVAEREEPALSAVAEGTGAPKARPRAAGPEAVAHRWNAPCATAKTEIDALGALASVQSLDEVAVFVHETLDIGIRLLGTLRRDGAHTRTERVFLTRLDANLAMNLRSLAQWRRSYGQAEFGRWMQVNERDDRNLAALAKRIGATDCIALFVG